MQQVTNQEAIAISEQLANNYKEIHQLAYSFFQDMEKHGFCELDRKGGRFIIKNSEWGTAETWADQRGD